MVEKDSRNDLKQKPLQTGDVVRGEVTIETFTSLKDNIHIIFYYNNGNHNKPNTNTNGIIPTFRVLNISRYIIISRNTGSTQHIVDLFTIHD